MAKIKWKDIRPFVVLFGLATLAVVAVETYEDPSRHNKERLAVDAVGVATGTGPELALGEGLVDLMKKH